MQICGVESWEFTYKLFAAYNNSVHGIHDKNLIIIVINHEYHEISGTPDRDTKIKFYKWFEDPVTTYLHFGYTNNGVPCSVAEPTNVYFRKKDS